ncbi:hypothetical protein F4678DRAFT_288153 [Xylaria arbuscula]|nr:hypothetical protein F4678DRAFT_288153 [Xylaria arbuscula]
MQSKQRDESRSATLRKACFSCVRAKRRCDKSLPSCRRCTDREETCRYPRARPYSRRRDTSEPDPEGPGSHDDLRVAPTTTDEESSTDLHSSSVDWDAVPGPLAAEPRNLQPSVESSVTFTPQLRVSAGFSENDDWSIHEYSLEDFQPKIKLSTWKSYGKRIGQFLEQWVTTNHCPFIHGQLYAESGLPPCLQDAYAAYTTYLARNENNEDFVLQLVEGKVNALLQRHSLSHADDTPESMETLSLSEHLTRVQALFIYQYIRLFDGDIRSRAQAERHDMVLQDWKAQMWECAKIDAYLLRTLDRASLVIPNSLGKHHQPMTQTWRDWILTESVRRIYTTVSYTLSVYLILRDGQASCPGSVPYTLRRGLWDATSAAEWSSLVDKHDPLFMRSDPPKVLAAKTPPLEVDIFGLHIVSLMWDSHRLESWCARSPGLNLEALLLGKSA